MCRPIVPVPTPMFTSVSVHPIAPLRILHCHGSYTSLYFLLHLAEKNNLIKRWIPPWDLISLSLSLSLSLSIYIYIYTHAQVVFVRQKCFLLRQTSGKKRKDRNGNVDISFKVGLVPIWGFDEGKLPQVVLSRQPIHRNVQVWTSDLIKIGRTNIAKKKRS